MFEATNWCIVHSLRCLIISTCTITWPISCRSRITSIVIWQSYYLPTLAKTITRWLKSAKPTKCPFHWQIRQLVRLMLTAPVTVASNERSFSQLKFVKNKLRTSMNDSRLTGFMLLTCEKDLTDTLDLEKVACWRKDEFEYTKTFANGEHFSIEYR
jgi:hypothetical protein